MLLKAELTFLFWFWMESLRLTKATFIWSKIQWKYCDRLLWFRI